MRHVQVNLSRGNGSEVTIIMPSLIHLLKKRVVGARPQPAISQWKVRHRQTGVSVAHRGPQNQLCENQNGACEQERTEKPVKGDRSSLARQPVPAFAEEKGDCTNDEKKELGQRRMKNAEFLLEQ